MAGDMPTHLDLMNPLLEALNQLGGSGTVEEMSATVSELLDVTDEILSTPHDPEKGSQTEIEYRLAWARNFLKHYGLLENSERGVWTLVPEKRDVRQIDPQEVSRTVRALFRERRASGASEGQGVDEETEEVPEEAQSWRAILHRTLTTTISPDGFERLVKRLLRESGFVQVEVTGRSGDGGIDGKGIVRVGGLLSFHVVFQCKRYQGSVSAGEIRDFRGAMIGRADKGLFVTTGSFSKGALQEATREGAPPLDLVDGEQLADMLKELRLGVKTEAIEKVVVDPEWFESI